MKKLKERWGVDSNWQITVIFLVFAITGSMASFIGRPILNYLNITPEGYTIIGYWIIRIILMFVLYQFTLVGFGWLFGQYKFFWNFEKKMLRRIGLKRFVD